MKHSQVGFTAYASLRNLPQVVTLVLEEDAERGRDTFFAD